MKNIRVLDSHTVNEIAAGEVIERPASVVKELLENAIDAGARKITVRIEEGGLKKIEVIDDGVGMTRDDAQLSIGQYTTSKISKIDDLDSLKTYGFRGEALASISSISRTNIRTRTSDEDVGTEVAVEFGEKPVISSIGTPVGTTVSVENLFANLPARKKHLSSVKTELSHVNSTVIKYAVIWSNISFDLFSDGKSIRNFRGPDRETRLIELLGPRAAKRLVYISRQETDLKIEGALTKMDVTRSSASSIFLFINNRPVTSSLILSAIADAYGTRLMRGRYPLGYLAIEISPELIDVNVHPTKREVRFARPVEVRGMIEATIEESFSEGDHTPKMGDLIDYVNVGKTPQSMPSSVLVSTMQAKIEEEGETASQAFPLEPLFQLFKTYIVATGRDKDSVIIIDQHASAERIKYEGIMRSLKEGGNRFQKLLSPSILELTSSEKSALEENIEHLNTLGFDIEPFGGESYRLVSVPSVLGQTQGESALKGVLDEIANAGRRRPLGEELIWKVACHGSIRAGQDLSRGQMKSLISDLLQTDNPYTCEHGRPTMISLKIDDLERLFRRRL